MKTTLSLVLYFSVQVCLSALMLLVGRAMGKAFSLQKIIPHHFPYIIFVGPLAK